MNIDIKLHKGDLPDDLNLGNVIAVDGELQIHLENHQIQTRPIFSGNILRHPAFKNLKSSKNKIKSFKNSDYIMKNGLLIGCHQGLDKKNIDYIHSKINLFLKGI